jgi:ribosome production factor 2
MLRIVKPKTKRAKRELEKRAPKIDENSKKILLLHGTKTSANIKQVLSDFYHLRKDGGKAIKYTKKNDAIRPFEGGGETSLEFLSQKTDCSLFAFGSHSKKRPNNLVLGRMFDHKVFDMMEVGIENFKSIEALGGGKKAAPQAGSKPCFAFIGEKFESDPKFRHFKELIVDFMRGEVVETINLQGLDKVFICFAVGEKVVFKHCAVRFKRSGTKVPRVELIEAGPCMDMVLRRNREPSDGLRKEAMRLAPKSTKKKIKNVSTDSLAGKVGRMYVPSQDVGEMALSKMKGLKRERRDAAAAKAVSKQDQSQSDVTMGEAEGSPNKKLKTSDA